ncbi:hypothetical protein JEQ12_006914 [Ovis aries]|uniref:Uncharacterized protein n=1 Tax=Ovis aries TaxID=9940 RepID=A0A835ZT80_SHEEP|nr:hypothetical protein JEQ12_006914 [Ovis aries]
MYVFSHEQQAKSMWMPSPGLVKGAEDPITPLCTFCFSQGPPWLGWLGLFSYECESKEIYADVHKSLYGLELREDIPLAQKDGPGGAVSSDLEETAGCESLPKRKKSFPKEEAVSDPEELENKQVPKKKRKFSSKMEPLSRGPEEDAASKSSGSKKKKELRKLSQEN